MEVFIGVPPHTYQQLLRTRKAKELLQAGKKLADVAMELSYIDQSHFTRQFKQMTGVTPGIFSAGMRDEH